MKQDAQPGARTQESQRNGEADPVSPGAVGAPGIPDRSRGEKIDTIAHHFGKIMQALGMERGEAIEHRMVTNAIEKAQRKVEGRNFDIRKQLLEYDDVANDQRQIIYRQRDELLSDDDIGETIRNGQTK